jgi:hypothetical protein
MSTGVSNLTMLLVKLIKLKGKPENITNITTVQEKTG